MKNNSKSKQPPHWVATRLLSFVAGDDKKATINIGIPEPVSDKEWRCAYQVIIEPTTKPEVQYGHGVDAFQALFMVLGAIRNAIDKSGIALVWLGETTGHGFPLFIPQIFGPDVTEHLEKMIKTELEFASALIIKLKRKTHAK